MIHMITCFINSEMISSLVLIRFLQSQINITRYWSEVFSGCRGNIQWLKRVWSSSSHHHQDEKSLSMVRVKHTSLNSSTVCVHTHTTVLATFHHIHQSTCCLITHRKCTILVGYSVNCSSLFVFDLIIGPTTTTTHQQHTNTHLHFFPCKVILTAERKYFRTTVYKVLT